MFINIGEKIKKYREAKEVTQDTFAQYLGVTCKEVVKWESGDIYPPVEQIPVIASYFGISTDELMCMEMFGNEDRIREYIDAFHKKVSSGDPVEAVEIIRGAIVHFPDEMRLKSLLMYGLYLSCDRPSAIKCYTKEIFEIGDDILSHCTDDSLRLEAKRIMCLHCYGNLRDTEKAREIALTLPPRKYCREEILPAVTENETRLSAVQENISSYTVLLINSIISYTESENGLTAKERIGFCEIARELCRAVYPDGDVYGGAYAYMTVLKDLAILYVSDGKPDKALDRLEECAKCAADFDALPKVSRHTSPLVGMLGFTKQQLQIPSEYKRTPLRDIFMNEIVSLQCFDALRYDQRINDICSILSGKKV